MNLFVASEIQAELERYYAEWFSAIPRHDNEFFGRVLADDWVYTNIGGEVRGKAEYLDYIKQVPEILRRTSYSRSRCVSSAISPLLTGTTP